MSRQEFSTLAGIRRAGHRHARTAAAGTLMWLCIVSTNAAAVTCSVSTPGVSFSAYNVFATPATPGTGTLKVTCSLTTETALRLQFTISLSAGSSNSFVQRQMKSGANTLGYNLYTANTYSVVWGDGTGSTSTVTGTMVLNSPNPSGTSQSTVYGQMPALQDAAVGSYSDNITVIVTY